MAVADMKLIVLSSVDRINVAWDKLQLQAALDGRKKLLSPRIKVGRAPLHGNVDGIRS